MDIQRKAFEAYMADRYKNTVDQRVCINSDGDYMAWDMQVAWNAWKAAKAQAVPEGFVLVLRAPTEEMIMNGLLVISTEVGKYDIQKEVRMIWEKMIEAQEQKG